MLATEQISHLSNTEISQYLQKAEESERKRFPIILHKNGDYENKVINFLKQFTYMQPHLHPGSEKIEHIYLIQGACAIIFFSDAGEVERIKVLNKPNQCIKVPAFKWHTYVMLTDNVITYETMDGVYKPESWKSFAQWAPNEQSKDAIDYLLKLRKLALNGDGYA